MITKRNAHTDAAAAESMERHDYVEMPDVMAWYKAPESATIEEKAALISAVRHELYRFSARLMEKGESPGIIRIYPCVPNNNDNTEIPERPDAVLDEKSLENSLAENNMETAAELFAALNFNEKEFIPFVLNQFEGVREAIVMGEIGQFEIWLVFDETRTDRFRLTDQCLDYFDRTDTEPLRYKLLREDNINRDILFPAARFLLSAEV